MLLVPLMMYYGIVPTAALVTLPLWIAALLISMLGAGLLLATLNVWYRDVHHLVNVGIQIWLFASPVAYPASLVHGGLRYVYFLNPIAGVLEGFRWCLLAGPAPKTPALVSLGSGLLLLYLGIRYFQASERRFADVI
jgi:lipopolysaccharide transport system permease protein